jgi:hypothetical protein
VCSSPCTKLALGGSGVAAPSANRFGRVGADDMQVVKDLLEALDNGATDMDLTGYSEEEIERLMNQVHQEPPAAKDDFDSEKLHIIITSATTAEQEALFVELTNRGIKCRLSNM